MPSIKLTLAYDGTAYAGWQFQPGQADSPGGVGRSPGPHHRRVDPHRWPVGGPMAGVHAEGQVVSFSCASRLAPEVLQRALNAELPPDIAVRDACRVADGFHATHDALRKRYRYVIHDGAVRDVFRLRYCWHFRKRLDTAAMQRAGPDARRHARLCQLPDDRLRARHYGPHHLRPPGRPQPPRAGRSGHPRSRGRRLPLQHGPHDCRHAGPHRYRQAARDLGGRGPPSLRPPRRRANRTGARTVSLEGFLSGRGYGAGERAGE